MPSEQMERLVAALYEEQAKEQANPPVYEWREGYEEFGRMFPAETNIAPQSVDAGGVPAAWLVSPQASDDRVLIYLHGGGYVLGSITTHLSITSRLTGAAKARVLALDYRLSPEHKFPAPVDDVMAAYDWLLDQGIDAKRTAIAGDSAGGGLTVAALLALRERGLSMPACAVPISPWVDLVGTGAWCDADPKDDPVVVPAQLERFVRDYLGSNDPHQPFASPLFADLAGLPPLLIQVGTREVLLSDATRFADRAKQAGVETTLEIEEGAFHVWHHAAPMVPEALAAIDRIGAFVQHHTP